MAGTKIQIGKFQNVRFQPDSQAKQVFKRERERERERKSEREKEREKPGISTYVAKCIQMGEIKRRRKRERERRRKSERERERERQGIETYIGKSIQLREIERRRKRDRDNIYGEVGGWGRVPFSRNLMSPTPRRKWYLTTGRRAH